MTENEEAKLINVPYIHRLSAAQNRIYDGSDGHL